MALAAYELVPDQSLDDRYHVAMIHLINDDPAAARAEADAILAEVPTHLFALATAAQAAVRAGNSAEARDFYERLIVNYDEELTTGREEYIAHEQSLPAIRAEAAAFLRGN